MIKRKQILYIKVGKIVQRKGGWKKVGSWLIPSTFQWSPARVDTPVVNRL
ncbi:unnamed protein product [Brassica oleracea var. botrytis]